MAKIEVKVRSDLGDLGIHPKHGQLVPGTKLTIEEEDFAAGLFERPKGFLSPHERADQERAAELKCRVGHQDPPAEPDTSGSTGNADPASAPQAKKTAKEVTLA